MRRTGWTADQFEGPPPFCYSKMESFYDSPRSSSSWLPSDRETAHCGPPTSRDGSKETNKRQRYSINFLVPTGVNEHVAMRERSGFWTEARKTVNHTIHYRSCPFFLHSPFLCAYICLSLNFVLRSINYAKYNCLEINNHTIDSICSFHSNKYCVLTVCFSSRSSPNRIVGR